MANHACRHVNNVVCCRWFDIVVNQFLISHGVLHIEQSPVIELVVETQCNNFASPAFPERVTAAMRVNWIGNASVRYEPGIFRNDDDSAAACGHFAHVHVDRHSRRPAAIPESARAAADRAG
jgi:acyl-CoA thioester hydrolase